MQHGQEIGPLTLINPFAGPAHPLLEAALAVA
jgi:hypothetical protein